MNRVILLGRLTRDVASFRLVTNERSEAEFHDIVAWRHLAEACARYLAKGRLVYLEGRLHGRSWSASDGTRRRAVEVVADTMQMLSPKTGARGHEE